MLSGSPRPSPRPSPGLRLHKYLAECGIASRRACEAMIAAGRVTVDGAVVVRQGTTIDPERARVAVDGRLVQAPQALRHLILYKPAGMLCTSSDPQGRPTIHHLLPALEVRLYSAGRLDEDSEGLLLVTNDGDMVHQLLHPRYHVPKTYHVWVDVPLEPEHLFQMRDGVRLEEGLARMDSIRPLGRDGQAVVYEVILREGRKRQIRRMIGSTRRHVLRLVRTGFGPLRLDGLEPGQWRDLTPAEVARLRAAMVLAAKPPSAPAPRGRRAGA